MVVLVVRGAFRKITLDIKELFMLLGINQGFSFKLSALLSSLIVRLDGKSDSVHQSLAPLAEGQPKTNTVFHESILRESLLAQMGGFAEEGSTGLESCAVLQQDTDLSGVHQK